MLRYHQVLHAALHQAVRWQLLARNPVDGVEPPRYIRRELAAIDPTTVATIFEAADRTPIGAFIRMAVLTGMRRGELLGLRWRDVDLDAGMLHVQQTAQRLTGQSTVYRQPKTRLSRRSIALSPVTVTLLRRHRRQQLEQRLAAAGAYQDADLIFGTVLGTPMDPGNLQREWMRLRRELKLPALRLHDLRHAHATLLLQQGVHPKVVSERLGRASIAITLDTYSHVLPGLQVSAAAALDTLLADAEPRSDVSNL